MKRHGNLYEKIITKENIALAYKRARRGKAWQRKVQKIDRDKERYLEELRLSLVNKTFHTAPYRLKRMATVRPHPPLAGIYGF